MNLHKVRKSNVSRFWNVRFQIPTVLYFQFLPEVVWAWSMFMVKQQYNVGNRIEKTAKQIFYWNNQLAILGFSGPN